MKVLFLIAALAVATALASAPFLTKDFVEEVNKQADGAWTASEHNGRLLEGASLEDIKKLLGTKHDEKRLLAPRTLTAEEKLMEIPARFEAATQWPNCPSITHIRDQSACGSCWAVAAAAAMSDRYCVAGGDKNLEISADNLMSCCSYCGDGCEGGYPSMAWSYWKNTGLTSDACQPYPFPKCAHHQKNKTSPYPPCPSGLYPTPACKTSCSASNASYTMFKGKSAYSVSGEENYQKELMARGPFEVSFSVYADFPTYTGGVYVKTSSQYLGGHAVRLVGWGSLNGVKYWKIANSWNDDWGMNGYFLIKRGVNECGIERAGNAGEPKL